MHVGTPKSGTTFLQQALWDNHDALKSDGFQCAGNRQKDMFLAAIEVRESHRFWGYEPDELAGTWRRLCRKAGSHSGTTIMSHEVLGAATEEQVARALAELEGQDVHVVLTVRDLARQVTSEWQERIKNGNAKPFSKFERRLVKQMNSGNFSAGFWKNQDPVGVLSRWTADLPPEKVHVVVAPPPGAGPNELWERFADAVGFDGSRIAPKTAARPANQTLGVAQIQVLRRVNAALDGRIRHPHYARVVKTQFAERLLAAQSSVRPQCPTALVEQLRVLAQERNDVIRARGYTVHGDLEHLVPVVPAADHPSPDDVVRKQERRAYAAAIAELLVDRAEPRPAQVLRDAAEAVPASGRLRRLGEAWRSARGD